MEANISDELTTSLDNILKMWGLLGITKLKHYQNQNKIDDAISIIGDLTRSPIDLSAN